MGKYIPNGKGSGKWSHGFSRKPETRYLYRIMERILQRCNNPKHKAFKNYGGRGIKVHRDWDHPSKFPAFFAHVGHRPSSVYTLERIDNNRNYEPGNVRWATRMEQQRNRRNNIILEFRGNRICRKDMAKKYGIPEWTLKKRLASGWSLTEALLIPVGSVTKGWRNADR